MAPFKVMFVCTGNVFRSMAAEHSFKKYLKDHKIKGIKVSSAGTIAKHKHADETSVETLQKLGVPVRRHTPKRISRALLHKQDLVISMHEDHQRAIKKVGSIHAPLFNQLAKDKPQSILDVDQQVPDFKTNDRGRIAYIRKTVKYIHKWIPKLYDTIAERYLLFEHFVQGNIHHRNGYPFMPLYETKHSLAFMSFDIPEKEDGHVLVIPKKRFKNFEKIPPVIVNDLMRTCSLVGKALMDTHQGYNILLNNGRSAGQFIFHSHFHLIPRNKGDDIKIEVWNRRQMKEKDFVKLNKDFKKRIQRIAKNF